MAAGNGLNLFLLIFSVLELLTLKILGGTYLEGKVKWEGMWVILVECMAYGASYVSPGEDFVSIYLTNGMWVEWMRYAGWILTCPVLLMTLVSMTTEDGTKAPTVRLVPLLVANLALVILGITSASNLPPAKWYIFAMALCFGGHVFAAAIQCFVALYSQSPNSTVRQISLWLAITFLAGWGCFPVAFLTGHSGMNIISTDVQWALFVIGDMLSKNCWVGIAVIRQYYVDQYNEQNAADTELGTSPAPGGARLIKRRGSNSCLIIDEINDSGVGFGTGTPSQIRPGRSTKSTSEARPTPMQQEVIPPSAPSDGEQADLDILKAVLARYHAMPLAEREALVPVFAGLLSEGNAGGQQTLQAQSVWLDREMDDGSSATPSIAAWSANQAAPRREADLAI